MLWDSDVALVLNQTRPKHDECIRNCPDMLVRGFVRILPEPRSLRECMHFACVCVCGDGRRDMLGWREI